MSRDYFLICRTCRIYLSVGKVYWLNDDGSPLDQVTFEGIYSAQDNQSHKRDEVFGRVMEKLFVLHRNHDLTFAPEGVDEVLEEPGKSIRGIDADDVMSEPIDPEVDWYAERENWRKRVRQTELPENRRSQL